MQDLTDTAGVMHAAGGLHARNVSANVGNHGITGDLFLRLNDSYSEGQKHYFSLSAPFFVNAISE